MTSATNFDHPIELRCIIDPTKTMRRLIPGLVGMAFAVWLLAALALGLAFSHEDALVILGSILISAVVTGMFYRRQRERLRVIYGERQRLVLHPGGLRRFDGTITTDMPWSGIVRFDYRNSSLPPARKGTVHTSGAMGAATAAALTHAHTLVAWGIVGRGTVSPLPTAIAAQLRMHDRLSGSNLAGGQPHESPQCLIFPGEFEADWQHGVVGAWLRHYRPDLRIPDGTSPAS